MRKLIPDEAVCLHRKKVTFKKMIITGLGAHRRNSRTRRLKNMSISGQPKEDDTKGSVSPPPATSKSKSAVTTLVYIHTAHEWSTAGVVCVCELF